MNDVVLGIHCSLLDGKFTSDGNVTLVQDHKVKMAVAEERVSRKKYDGDFRAALAYILDRTKVKASDISLVGLSTFGLSVPPQEKDVETICALVRDSLPGFKGEIKFAPSHHEIHALSAACVADGQDALIAVLDNEGSLLSERKHSALGLNKLERTSYYLYRDGNLSMVARDHDDWGDVGYGKLYSKVTRYVGFRSYHEAGKTMGLAPFGCKDVFSEYMVYRRDQNAISSMRNSEDGIADLMQWFADRGVLLPDARKAGMPLRKIDADLAWWVQNELEESVSNRITGLVSKYSPEIVCISGGVALNSVMNAKLRMSLPVQDVIVPPSPGDAGLSMGAAAWAIWQKEGIIPNFGASPYYGGSYSSEEIIEAAKKAGDITVKPCENLTESVACALADGKIIALFSGASEFGPRALGHRSFLVNPSNAWTTSLLNSQVKNREWFRPYAPVVIEEKCAECFVSGRPTPYMMHIDYVRPEAAKLAQATVHVDGTARLQTVHKALSPEFHGIISRFSKMTGVPMVLNTSFNLGGDPIVETPQNAIETFMKSSWIDALFLGNHVITAKASANRGCLARRKPEGFDL